MKEFMVSLNAPLKEKDTESQTEGCRANNPDICASNMLPDICAFCNEDHICRKPSRAWKKQYQRLKEAK